MGNNPIRYVDLDGREIKVSLKYRSKIRGWVTDYYTWDNHANCFRDSSGRTVSGNEFIDDVTSSLIYLKNSNTASKLIEDLSDIKDPVIISKSKPGVQTKFEYNGNKGFLYFNNNSILDLNDGTGSYNSSALGLAHELVHAEDYLIKGILVDLQNIELKEGFLNASELRAVFITDIIATELGEALRFDYVSARTVGNADGSVTMFYNNQ